jgi:hypothetical protein
MVLHVPKPKLKLWLRGLPAAMTQENFTDVSLAGMRMTGCITVENLLVPLKLT